MDKRSPARLLWSFTGYGFFFYFLIILAALLFVNRSRLTAHAGPSTLSRLRPNYQSLGFQAIGERSLDHSDLKDMVVYLENVNRVMGERADAFLFLAYCYYHLNDIGKADQLFLRVIELSPDFFWAHHGAGVLAMQRADFARAIDHLTRALTLPDDAAIKAVLSSRVFSPLFLEAGYTPELILRRMMDGRRDAAQRLCQLFLDAGRWNDAVGVARQGVMISDTSRDRANFLYFMGAAFRRSGEILPALKAFEEALKNDENHQSAIAETAAILKEVGQLRAAEIFSRKAGVSPGPEDTNPFGQKDVLIRAF